MPATNGGDPRKACAADISPALEGIVAALPDKVLALKKCEGKFDETDAGKWILSAEPVKSWPVPGFPKATVDIEGSKAKLKVTDKGNDKDCDYELNYSGKIQLGTTLPVSLTMSGDNKYQVVVGDNSGKSGDVFKISPVALADRLDLPGLSETLRGIAELIHLENAGLISATIKFKVDPATRAKTMTAAGMVCSLNFGALVLQLSISVPQGGDGKLDSSRATVTATWPSADDPDGKKKQTTLGAVLERAGLPFALPPALDVPLKTFSIASQYIEGKAQLHKKDTRRLVFSSPAPNLAIVVSYDSAGERRVTARIGWDSVSLTGLPVIGDKLPGALTPLLLLVTAREISVKEMAALCNMKEFEGLETLGVAEDKLKSAPPMKGGAHCAGIFAISGVTNVAFHFALYERKNAPGPPALVASTAATPTPATETVAESRSVTTVDVQRNVGPVALTGIGFKFENGAVSILLRISLTAGGMKLEMIGLRVSFNVSTKHVSAGIDGILLGFSSGSVQIAGGLARDTSSGQTDWAGMAQVRVGSTFALDAAMAFAESDPKKLFLFGYSRRQIGGPPACCITGIAGGFGYNRDFIVPAVDHVNQFPFIQMANSLARGGTGDIPPKLNPGALWGLLNGIRKYVPPSSTGTDFLTFGFTCTSFGLIDSTILAAIVFGSRVQFVILGSASIDVPKNAPIAHADLEVVASVQPDEGLLAVDAVLGPGSYVLSKQCRLTGGFSWRLWFSGEHAGDFVVSFGGYHPRYVPPKNYPLVPRLGFLWKVSGSVQISGWSYFAITPHSVQAGGGLDVVLDADPLRAWCHAEAHFLIHWKPFYYDVHLYVDFGVSFRMDMLFCTVTITADISADLEIWGPDFTGHAEVHLWFVSFGIDFGAGASRDLPKCQWPEFVSAFLTPAPPPAPKPQALHALHAPHPMPAAADPPGTPVLEIIPVNGTRVAPKESGHDWYADPQTTTFKVKTTMPAKTAALNTDQIANGEGIKIFAKPVVNSPQIDPHLHVRVEEQFGTNWKATKQLQARPAVTAVPTALWGASGQQGELTPGLTDVHLTTSPVIADSTAEVPVAGLLFEDARPITAAWQKPPAVSADSFDWTTSNPFRTINADPARQSRTAVLADLAAMGYVDAKAIAAIDFTNFKPEQPCYMANPALCRLGAERAGV